MKVNLLFGCSKLGQIAPLLGPMIEVRDTDRERKSHSPRRKHVAKVRFTSIAGPHQLRPIAPSLPRQAAVTATYQAEFVVPYGRPIVAHGQDVQAVLKEAAVKTGRRIEELLVVGIDVPLHDVPH